jgi:hypothetical protein
MKSRPLGIAALSLLLFLNAAFYGFLAVLSLVDFGALTSVLRALSPGGVGPAEMHLALGKFLTVYYGVFALFTWTLAWGFWRLRNWTRLVALALMGLSLAFLPIELLRPTRSLNGVTIASALVRVGVTVMLGYYLLSAKVREAFHRSASRSAHPAE